MAKDTAHFFGEEYTTAWDLRRKVSDWHFDPEIISDEKKHVKINPIKFRGDWNDEIENIHWVPALDPKNALNLDNYIDRLYQQEEMLIGTGPAVSGEIVGKINAHDYPKLTKIAETFGLQKPKVSLLKHPPGACNPLHLDSMCDPHFSPTPMTDPQSVLDFDPERKIKRVLIQLRDWCWGQFSWAGNMTWTQWKAGDMMWFDYANIPHGAANAGHKDRIIMKVTGFTSTKFESLLEQQDQVVNIE